MHCSPSLNILSNSSSDKLANGLSLSKPGACCPPNGEECNLYVGSDPVALVGMLTKILVVGKATPTGNHPPNGNMAPADYG